jgi:hypothetical protein
MIGICWEKFHAAATFSFFVITAVARLIGRPSYIQGGPKKITPQEKVE